MDRCAALRAVDIMRSVRDAAIRPGIVGRQVGGIMSASPGQGHAAAAVTIVVDTAGTTERLSRHSYRRAVGTQSGDRLDHLRVGQPWLDPATTLENSLGDLRIRSGIPAAGNADAAADHALRMGK